MIGDIAKIEKLNLRHFRWSSNTVKTVNGLNWKVDKIEKLIGQKWDIFGDLQTTKNSKKCYYSARQFKEIEQN